jgi:hypothetical protein
MKDGLLEPGDVIELKAGHRVYATVMWKFANRKQAEPYHNDVNIADHPELAGEYVVDRTSFSGGSEGGGMNGHDDYPDGHHVYCKRLEDQTIEVDFYQSGCFTAMIEKIKPVGKATRTITPWVKVDEDLDGAVGEPGYNYELTRRDDCPIGHLLQPGCDRCKECEHHVSMHRFEPISGGDYWTRCAAPLKK